MRHAILLLGVLSSLLGSPLAPSVEAAGRVTQAKLPFYFEPNHGQTDAAVLFRARGPGYTLFLTPTEAVLSLARGSAGQGSDPAPIPPRDAAVRLRFLGANPAPAVVGRDALAGTVNYLRGNDPTRWRINVPTFAKVQYREIYPGVDLVFYGTQGQVEHDFVVAPGADPRRIQLAIQGARAVRRDSRGDLVLRLPGGDLRLRAPVAYQEIDGVRRLRHARYVLQPGPKRGTHRLGFRLGPYDRTRPLVIDPLLVYATYLGGNNVESGSAIAVDAAGSAYVTGWTTSSDFPTDGPPGESPLDATLGGPIDAFVAKLTPSGSALAYATYLGGSGDDRGAAIAVDAVGSAYVTGWTTSSDFPTAMPFDASLSGPTDAFVAKLTSTGSALVYATYLGGGSGDSGHAIAVDAAGSAYVTGYTESSDLPTAAPFDASLSGPTDVFVAKLTATGSALVYATYLGGSGDDRGAAIAVDVAGSAYVTGYTGSSDFPTAAPPGESPLQPASAGGYDVFVAKLTPVGSALTYATYLGGSAYDWGWAIAVDGAGRTYVTGWTDSLDFPTAAPLGESPFQPASAGGYDVFVAKLTPVGSALTYATYLGGSSDDYGSGIAVDDGGSVYVTGQTVSSNFPTAAPPAESPFQAGLGGPTDAFVAWLDMTAPTVTITWPTTEPTYFTTEATLDLAGTAGDAEWPVGQVTWSSDRGGSGAAVGTSEWSVTGLPMEPGVNVITATAEDLAGNIGTAVLTVTYDRPPAPPTGLEQRQADGTTPIALGGSAVSPTVVFRGTPSDPDAGQVRLQVEVRPLGTAFTGTVHCQSAFVSSGTTTSCTVSSLTLGADYHWQSRAVDSLGVAGEWAPYAANAEDDADFRVNAVPVPSARGQRQANGTTPIGLGGWASSPTVVFLGTVSDADPGQQVRLQVEVQPLGTAFTGAVTCESVGVPSGTPTSCAAAGLTRGTRYHWQSRAVDTSGTASAWASYATNAEDAADFGVSTAPAVPSAQDQRQGNGTTVIALGGWARFTTVIFEGTVSDPDPGQRIGLQVEVQPLGTAFTGTAHCRSALVASGTVASCRVRRLVPGTGYHWRSRTADGTGLVSAWASHGTNPEDAADFVVNTPPAPPTARGQRQANGTTPIGLGGLASSPTVVFLGTPSDPDPGQQVRFQVEVQPVGTAFTGTAHCQSALVASGTATSCSVTSLVPGTGYHWRTRAVDSLGIGGPWASYATNAEDAADFVVNAAPLRPTARGQRQADGTTPIGLGGWASSPTVVFLGTPSDPNPGQQVRLQVEVQPVGTAFTSAAHCQSALVASGTATSCSVSGLTPGTSYHWQTRTVDAVGVASPWASYATNAEDAADFVVNPLAAGVVDAAP
jgi:hypothetical protein